MRAKVDAALIAFVAFLGPVIPHCAVCAFFRGVAIGIVLAVLALYGYSHA